METKFNIITIIMHRKYVLLLLGSILFLLLTVSCNGNENESDSIADIVDFVEGENHNILVVYFSEPLPENGVDAVTSASRVMVDGDVYGSVQYMATVIADATGGDVARIRTVIPYAENFDDLAERADQERQNGVHPGISVAIDDFDSYDVIFVGYPIWWYQMPMALYSFFDEYDFTGKTIIPFSSHGGSSWSGTREDIAGLEPGATMVEGYSISRNSVAGSENGIREWLRRIGMLKQ